jgi:hypothetical protein
VQPQVHVCETVMGLLLLSPDVSYACGLAAREGNPSRLTVSSYHRKPHRTNLAPSPRNRTRRYAGGSIEYVCEYWLSTGLIPTECLNGCKTSVYMLMGSTYNPYAWEQVCVRGVCVEDKGGMTRERERERG